MFVRRIVYWVLFVTVFLPLAGCGFSEDEIAVTVEKQVSIAVVETLTAVSTATSQSTLTPDPTHTPYPTSTGNPTYTPYPTYTPVPTFTPTATFTPEPTATPEPTNAPIAVPLNTPLPVVDLRTQLLEEIDKTRAEVELFSWIISLKLESDFGVVTGRNPDVDCSAAVNTFDSIVNTVVLDTSSSDPDLQNAYNLYLESIDRVRELVGPWTDACRETLANGETHKFIEPTQSNMLRILLEDQSINLLRQAILSLTDE